MPLVDMPKNELQLINRALLHYNQDIADNKINVGKLTYKNIDALLEKVEKLLILCECGGQHNWYIIQHKWGSYYVRWGNQNLYNYL